MSVRRLVAAVAALAAMAGAVVLTVSTAGADNLTCLSPVASVQWGNAQAGRADLAGDVGHATAVDSYTTYYQNLARDTCYFNPNVPYDAYENAISGFTYVNAALFANQAGNVSAAVADGRVAATYLNAAVDILDKGP